MHLRIFLYGFLAACFALILELIFLGILPWDFFVHYAEGAPLFLTKGMVSVTVLFAIFEEGCRFVFLQRYKRNYPYTAFPSLGKIAFIGGTFGLGFAFIETLGVVATRPLSAGFVSNMVLHISLSTVFAYSIFLKEGKRAWIISVFLLAVALHSVYNFFVSSL